MLGHYKYAALLVVYSDNLTLLSVLRIVTMQSMLMFILAIYSPRPTMDLVHSGAQRILVCVESPTWIRQSLTVSGICCPRMIWDRLSLDMCVRIKIFL